MHRMPLDFHTSGAERRYNRMNWENRRQLAARAGRVLIFLLAKIATETLAFAGAIIAYLVGGSFFLEAIVTPKSPELIPTVVGLLVGVVFFFAFGMWIYCTSAIRSSTLEYIAPIWEQVAALPENKLLVRGSADTEAAARELLRSANVAIDRSSTELLRVPKEI